MDRQSETIIGVVFLGFMLVFLILSITTFEGTPTVLLLIGALIFLGVGLFFLSGRGSGGDSDGQSQQQSVVLGGGEVITQSFSSARCPSCGRGIQSNFAHCPHCGAAVAGTR